MIYILQVVTILFSLAIAKHDAPAVDHFEFYGPQTGQMKAFHKWNLVLKFFFCLLASIPLYPLWLDMLIAFGLSGLWVWLTFDIFLNRFRAIKQPWDYLGSNDADGRRWIKLFGDSAGELKAILLGVLIIALNLIHLKYFVL
ncbi:MAG: hypothetical protein ACT4OJ_06225 [Bacteroidota bacterium]